jgi:hypothetical protein
MEQQTKQPILTQEQLTAMADCIAYLVELARENRRRKAAADSSLSNSEVIPMRAGVNRSASHIEGGSVRNPHAGGGEPRPKSVAPGQNVGNPHVGGGEPSDQADGVGSMKITLGRN